MSTEPLAEVFGFPRDNYTSELKLVIAHLPPDWNSEILAGSHGIEEPSQTML